VLGLKALRQTFFCPSIGLGLNTVSTWPWLSFSGSLHWILSVASSVFRSLMKLSVYNNWSLEIQKTKVAYLLVKPVTVRACHESLLETLCLHEVHT